jgi:hypothetical protein
VANDFLNLFLSSTVDERTTIMTSSRCAFLGDVLNADFATVSKCKSKSGRHCIKKGLCAA